MMTSKDGYEYKGSIYLLPRHYFHRFIKQDKRSYKTHKYSCMGIKNKRKVRRGRYSRDGFTIPMNHVTYISENSKGILIGISHYGT